MDFDPRTPSFGRALSENARFVQQHPGSGRDCGDNQCAEDGLNPEECGNEDTAPIDQDNLFFGFDKRPLLPIGLTSTTFISGCCVLLLHCPYWGEMTGDEHRIAFFFCLVYMVVLVTMSYTALCDPGQIHPLPGQAGIDEEQAPRRSRKAWLYAFPIRRYDHYCRWLCNVIGLLNHRSFVLMCGGLMISVVIGGLMDIPLMYHTAARSAWKDCWIFFFHMGYCCTVLWFLGPIAVLHFGFVSRNELAHEWNKNFYNVVYSDRRGMVVHVNDLSDDEFNDKFDEFDYDRSRNPWDNGMVSNCLTFWFHSRSDAEELGEF